MSKKSAVWCCSPRTDNLQSSPETDTIKTIEMTVTQSVHFYVNGKPHTVENADPEVTLANFLRETRELLIDYW